MSKKAEKKELELFFEGIDEKYRPGQQLGKIIAVINQKGGVGKTTTTGNLGYVLAKKGYDVLLVDFDSQASLTNYVNYGLDGSDYYSIYDLLLNDLREIEEDDIHPEIEEMDFEEILEHTIIRPTYLGMEEKVVDGKKTNEYTNVEFGFDLLPSHLNLSDYEMELSGIDGVSKGTKLASLIDRILRIHRYDFVILDCNPSLGTMAVNAICAARAGVLIPTNLDLMSTRGVTNLIDKIVDVQEHLQNRNITHMGVIGVGLNLYSDRRVIDRTIQHDLKRFYPFKIFNGAIPESVQAKKAVYAGELYAQRYDKAKEAYTELAKEILLQLIEMDEKGPVIQRITEDEE